MQWVGVSPSSRMYCVQWVAVPALDGLLAISSKWVVERPPLQQALRPCYGDHSSTFVCVGLSSKIRGIIEGGPPEGLVQCFNTLFADKIEKTNAAALEAKCRLGW